MPPKLTQPLRPAARYRPGKAPVPVADDSDYSDQEQEQEAQGTAADEGDDDDDDEQVTEFRTTTAGKSRGTAALNVALKEVQVDQTGKVKVGGRDEVGRTEMESSEGEYGPFTPEGGHDAQKLISIPFAETDSEEEQDKAPAKPVFRPKAAAPAQQASPLDSPSMHPRTQTNARLCTGVERVRDRLGGRIRGGRAAQTNLQTRVCLQVSSTSTLRDLARVWAKRVITLRRNRDTIAERQKELEPEALEAKREEEERKRREEAKALVADSIVREIASSASLSLRIQSCVGIAELIPDDSAQRRRRRFTPTWTTRTASTPKANSRRGNCES